MAEQFKSYQGYIGMKPVWVINEGTFKESGKPALKVKFGVYGQYQGWSGGRVRREIYYSKSATPKWVPAESVSRKQTEEK